MSDLHGRDGHDLPPCPKAKVFAGTRYWYWHHLCPWHGHRVASGGYDSWAEAFTAADRHMQHCEAS